MPAGALVGPVGRSRETGDEGADGVAPRLFGVIAQQRGGAVLDDGEPFAEGIELEGRLGDGPAAEATGGAEACDAVAQQ